MKYIFYLLLLTTQMVFAQKLKRADKAAIAHLQTNINFLASPALEGRRTGSAGEKLAYEYLVQQMDKVGLTPRGDSGSYIQSFAVPEGKKIAPETYLFINGSALALNKEYFPLAFSANKNFEAMASIALQENGAPWLYDLKEVLEAHKDNPHFDINQAILIKMNNAAKKGATALLVYNSSSLPDGVQFEPKSTLATAAIPVVYITNMGRQNYLKDETATLDIKLRTMVVDNIKYGHNVVGFLNNNAANTVIIGAHYDHLGYGEDKTSLYSGAKPQVHPGADDNASGTAAILEMAQLLKASKLKNNNYLFICFSGEELGLFGSKYFTNHPTIDLSTVNYMINLDMVGRLNDSSHALTIGGVGTSPAWTKGLATSDKYFTLKLDSSGTGPSDHTSFYQKNIPVLFFFTGLHSDYHRPSDVADKINFTGEWWVVKYIYQVIAATNNLGKIIFTPTKTTISSTAAAFKVTLGIMPDYAFSGLGVRADGLVEGRIAQQVGIKAGDIIVQLGPYKFSDLHTYMETLSKFNKGDATTVKVKRGAQELNFDIVF